MKFTVCFNQLHLCTVEAIDWQSALIQVTKDHPAMMVFAGVKPSVCKRNEYGHVRLLDVNITRKKDNLFIGECQ